MSNAKEFSCDILFNTKSLSFAENIRKFQGCPTLAITKGGRIFAGWYAGGTREPHMDNYNLLIYSDDFGETWSEQILVIPSSYEKNIHALDIQLFVDPAGALHIFWVQNNVRKADDIDPEKIHKFTIIIDGYHFYDLTHSEWEVVCHNPDSDDLKFTEPKYVFQGFLRCKPTVLNNGDWLCFAYDQTNNNYGYSITKDNGKTFTHHYGSEKLDTVFDETMAFQMDDGTIRMFARTHIGELAESYSTDNGLTWSDTQKSGIIAANSRFYVKKLPSGRVVLILNDDAKTRTNMTVMLSEDDGKTWKYKVCLDSRENLSYPDADYFDGRIYLVYDRGRTIEKEIIFATFTEDDIINQNDIELKVISCPE